LPTKPTEIADYRFTPADLAVAKRRPGISAFMRIRDGAYSLEAAIRSHIRHFDEIVAVHNRASDETPAILARLAAEFGERLRVFHYVPPVFPPGSEGHRREPADSPLSLVNYYNFALSRTRFAHVTKLDDDHIAMDEAMGRLAAEVRAGRAAQGEMACFSGVNLSRDEAGAVGVLAREPFAGAGDHWIFPVTPETYFRWDRRFEVLRQGGMKRRFHSFAYWHLKYLKPDFGFANYDLAQNPTSRYARRLKALETGRAVVDLDELSRQAATQQGWPERLARLGLPVPERDRILIARRRAATAAFRGGSLTRVRDPELQPFLRS
jgi:hypothetical protein